MEPFTLPDSTQIGEAHLYVSSLDRSLAFYSELMGFGLLHREGDLAALSADGMRAHLRLSERPTWKPKPRQSTGLYHVAIRFPGRRELARTFRRMLAARYPFSGFSDHAVSEALYLNDPDGNGLEMYTDRPRDQWRWQGDQVSMTTEPLDLDDLLAQADDQPWEGIDPGTDIGHVHLHVSDLTRAKALYGDVLGLNLIADWSRHGALFMAAGRYHHHLGLNIWAGTARQPAETLGLRAFSLAIREQEAWETAGQRAESAGFPTAKQDERTLRLQDADGNTVELSLVN